MKPKASPRVWPVLLAAGISLAILLSLGVWQVKRLAWKEELIAKIEASMMAPATSLADALVKPDIAYARVLLTGQFASNDFLLVMATANGGPAWNVVRPFTLAEGGTVLVDCGKSLTQEPPPPPAGLVKAEALIQHHGGRGYFDPVEPTSGNVFIWWNLAAMAEKLTATQDAFTLSLLPGQLGTEGLLTESPKATLRNNHLGYAITWFGLAAALVVVTGVFLWGRGKQS